MQENTENTESNEVLTNTENLPKNEKTISDGWSWGGSFLFFYMLIAAKKWGIMIIYIISLLLPFINILAFLGGFIYGGLKGKEFLLESPLYKNSNEAIGGIRTFELFGKITAVLTVIVIVMYSLLAIFLISLLQGFNI